MIVLFLLLQKPAHLDEYSVCKLKLRLNSNKSATVANDSCIHSEQPPQDEIQDSDSDTGLSNTSFSVHGNLHYSEKSQLRGLKNLKSSAATDTVRSTDSDVQSDELSPLTKHKMVAIDTSRNTHFTRRLLPVQSPEFDNVIDQVCINLFLPPQH